MHKLAALRLLSDRSSKLDRQYQRRIERGEDPADVDRETALMTLTEVVKFFENSGIESIALFRLLSALTALTAGARTPAMLAPLVTRNRRPDAPSLVSVKGRLAAIMEFQQRAGLSRKAAGEWVAQHIPSKLKRELRSTTGATVDSWLVKWGGDRGATPGSGRQGYLHMRAILAHRNPTEQQLKKIIEVQTKLLPS